MNDTTSTLDRDVVSSAVSSVVDPELFNPSSSIYTGDLNLRCFMYPSAVQPVARFIDGLRALRPRRPDLFVLGVIAGVPPDLVSDPDRIDYDEILADPRMQEEVDTSSTMTRLRPSCNVPGRGLAFPPRRLVQVARAFGAQGSLQSICLDDYGPALDTIIRSIYRYGCTI